MTKPYSYMVYSLNVPADALRNADGASGASVDSRRGVGGSDPAVEVVGAKPDSETIRGSYRGEHAHLMAGELKHLFNAKSVRSVAIFGTAEDGSHQKAERDGYYALENLQRRPGDLRDPEEGYAEWTATLSKIGTRRTHWRSIRSTVSALTNPWSTHQTARMAVPSTASKVRWLDPGPGVGTEPATVQATLAGEHASVDVYHASEPAFSNPTLIYEMPYEDEGKADPTVWDDRGTTKTDADGVVQWRRVFSTDHEYEGTPVIDNGLLRLTLDESAGLSFDVWDDAAASWEHRSLGPMHNVMDSLTNITTGSNSTAATAASPSVDGTSIRGTTDSTATQGNRHIEWTPPSAIDLSHPGDIKFWYKPNTTAGANALELVDSAGATESVDFSGQSDPANLTLIRIPPSDFVTVDLTAVANIRWVYDGDGTGIDRTIYVDRFAGASPWSLLDRDVTRAGDDRCEGQLVFDDGTSHYNIDLSVQRGIGDVVFSRPGNASSPVPQGLVDRLAPAAYESSDDAMQERDLTHRSEARL